MAAACAERIGRGMPEQCCHATEDPQSYGYAASFGLKEPCQDEAVQQLAELHRRAADYLALNGRRAADDFFFAEQNARLVKHAEHYYRAMFGGRVSSWNLRDRHMMESLEGLVEHLGKHGPPPKIVVWAHNSHLGDARATQMGEQGELNIGQLVRERHGLDAVLYLPETERISHYFEARLADQFDALLHFDETRALQPLEPIAQPPVVGVEETFPSGF